jgi:hypothetical protein
MMLLPTFPVVASRLRKLVTTSAAAAMRWTVVLLLLLAGVRIAHAGEQELEFRVDPARAAHSFGAWVNQSPWSNGPGDGIHDDQNGQLYYLHLPSLDPRNFPYGPYYFFDGTANEIILIQASDVVNDVVDLRNRDFVPLSGNAKKYIALPNNRSGHTFAIYEPTTETVTPITVTTRTASFGPNPSDYFVEGFATITPAAGWYVVDLTTYERAPTAANFLPGVTWTFEPAVVPMDEMRLDFASGDAGYHFTFRYQLPGMSDYLQQISPYNDGVTTSTYVAIPRGASWWVTRDVDGTAYEGTPTDGNGPLVTDLQSTFPARSMSYVEIMVHASDGGSYAFRQPHGSFPANLQYTGQSMPISNEWAPGGYDYFYYNTFSGYIDSGMSFAVERTDTGEMLPEGQTIYWGSFQLTPPPPIDTVILDVIASRASQVYVTTPQGEGYYASSGSIMGETRPSAWPNDYGPTYTHSYYRLTLDRPATGSWSMSIANEWGWWETYSISAGYIDYREWYRTAQRQFQISVTRFGHDLRVRQPHTSSEYYLNTQGTSGSYIWDGQTYYYYFDADAYLTDDVDFWVYDATTGETAPLNTVGLATWTDLVAPTIHFTTDHGTGGAHTLNFQFNSDYASDVILEQRPDDWSSDWVTVGNMPLSGATWGAMYSWTINVPQGDPYRYRLRTALGTDISGPSNDVTLWYPPDSSMLANYTEMNVALAGSSYSAAVIEWASDAPPWEGIYLVQVRNVAIGAWRTVGIVYASQHLGQIPENPNFYRYRFAPIGLFPGKSYEFRVRLNRPWDDNYENYSPTLTLTAPPDTDKDGIPDAEEIAIGTDPNDPDSDNDGYSDGEEIAAGTSPTDSGSTPGYPPPGGGGGGDPGGGGDDPPVPPDPENIPEIPTVNYATIDLTEITGVKPSGGMALGDDGSIAFCEKTDSGYRVAVWNPDGSYKTGNVPDKDPDGAPLYVVGITSNGMLAGNTLGFDKNKKRTISVVFKAEPGWGGGSASISYPFLSANGDCFKEFDISECDQDPNMIVIPLPSRVQGVARMSGPWGTNVAWEEKSYECSVCCGSNIYDQQIKYKHFVWTQVFTGSGAVLPDAEISTGDSNNDGKTDDSEIGSVTVTFDPDPYPSEIIDNSFGGGSYFATWVSSGAVPLDGTVPAIDRGTGFAPDQNAADGVERGKTNDAPQGVDGLDLVTSAIQAAQDKIPSLFQDYVKITEVTDNGNGDTLLAKAKVFLAATATAPAGWHQRDIRLQGSQLFTIATQVGAIAQIAAGGAKGAAKNAGKAEAKIEVQVDVREPQEAGAPPLTPAQGDDFAVVSKGLDNELASELSITYKGTGSATATLKMKGTDGNLKFENASVPLTAGTPATVKIWGLAPSTGENTSKIEVEIVNAQGQKAKTEEDLTIIEGVKLEYEGKFYCPVDTRNYMRRPGDGVTTGYPPGHYLEPTAPTFGNGDALVPGCVAQDTANYSSKLQFWPGDQGIVRRAWSPAPRVNIKKITAIKPHLLELKNDALMNGEVHMTQGRFLEIRFGGGNDILLDPKIELRIAGAADAVISVKTTEQEELKAAPGGAGKAGVVALMNAALGIADRQKLAQWIKLSYGTDPATNLDNYAVFIEDLSKAGRKWEGKKFEEMRGPQFKKSLAAKALSAWQEVKGKEHIKTYMEFRNFFEWELFGDIEKSLIETH